jgi:hypothetical protein
MEFMTVSLSFTKQGSAAGAFPGRYQVSQKRAGKHVTANERNRRHRSGCLFFGSGAR